MTRVVLDGTEICIKKPSLPDIQELTFSTYKNLNICQALVGTSHASGVIIFVSDPCAGSISGKEFTNLSGVLSLLERGAAVMGDQGFDIQDD